LIDINVGAFEAILGRIQDFDYENGTRKPFNYSSKVES
jgi:hypothetical protein